MDGGSDRTIRVAILSDTHGFICPDVLDIVSGCDMAVHAGDIGGRKVLDQLATAVASTHAVRGNNDVPGLWVGDELEALDPLPWVSDVELPGGTLAVEHGHAHGPIRPDHASLRAAHPGARVIVYGHTHKLLVDRSKSPWVVNPGAAGRTRNRSGPSCLVLHAGPDSWDVETFRFARLSA